MTFSILELALSDVGELRMHASTNGGEYVGPCPSCGGVDRFHVWPKTGRYWCRQCGASGDAIQYLRDFRGASYADACQAVGREPQTFGRIRGAHKVRDIELREPPSPAWQSQARAYVDRAQRALWGPAGRTALEYLRRRGLSDATIRGASLGYSPAEAWAAPGPWGMADRINQQTGKAARVWMPRGVVIPCVVDGVLWFVKVRRLPTDTVRCPRCKAERRGPGRCACGTDLPRYVMVRGSVPALFGADSLSGATAGVFVGGELDALLLHQVAGDFAAVLAWGAGERGLTKIDEFAPFVDSLLPVPVFLVALDADSAGARGADILMRLSRRFRRARLPSTQGAKDITDWHLAGVDLRAWLAGELASASGLHAQTSDGGRSLVALPSNSPQLSEALRVFATETGAEVFEVIR